jgi:hypothetical protein
VIDWAELGKLEKSVRVTLAVALAVRLINCARHEDLIGAAINGLSAVGALGLDASEIRSVLDALERTAEESKA